MIFKFLETGGGSLNGSDFFSELPLRLLNALNSEDRGLKVRFPLEPCFEINPGILCSGIGSY